MKKDSPPEDAMGLGIKRKVKDWFDKNNTAIAEHKVSIHDRTISVSVDGYLVLERFNTEIIEGIPDDILVELKEVSGEMTILNLLGNHGIYERLKSFYTRVLDNCLGKSIEKQRKYLFGENSNRLKTGEIEASEEGIRTFPDVATDKVLKEIANEIISGKLEYAYPARDEFMVEMHRYANALVLTK